MKVSYNWLKEYVELPTPEEVVEALTFHVFEVESLEKVAHDAVLDVKVLPDRAHYALSHKGVAYELAAILNKKLREREVKGSAEVGPGISVMVESDACRRYSARCIKGVTVGESPAWLKEKLEAIGQRTINCVVDITNFVMFDLGQPLHAFDADKVVGGITVRQAKSGEVLELLPLDGQERTITLTTQDMVIADEAGPLALAGVKGGMRAAVTAQTKNIILEAANFEPVTIRRTAARHNIRNDSSKRFENDVTPELVPQADRLATSLFADIAQAQEISPVTDVYPSPQKLHTISVSTEYISKLIGADISISEMKEIFARLSLPATESAGTFTLSIPAFRLDLVIPQDVVEEVGRIHGYRALPSVELSEVSAKPLIDKEFYYAQLSRDVLSKLGFSEVYTYALTSHGDVEIINPLAADKNFLRHSLEEGITKSLELNARNAPLLGLDEIAIFEVGTVFSQKSEQTELVIGYSIVKNIKNKDNLVKEKFKEILTALETAFDGSIKSTQKNNLLTIDLSASLKKLPEPQQAYMPYISLKSVAYKKISAYPFSMRDIAVFVPETVTDEQLKTIIAEKAGSLLVRCDLFDVFKKQFPDSTSKTSYAFHLIFQSMEKTLEESEISGIMNAITAAFTASGGEVR